MLDKGPYRESLWLHNPPDEIGIVSDVNTVIEADEWRTIDWVGKSPVGHFFANAKNLRISGIDFIFRRDSGHGIWWSNEAGVFENCTFHATEPPTQDDAWLYFTVQTKGSNPIQFTLKSCSIVGRVNVVGYDRRADLTVEENLFHDYPVPQLSISGTVGRVRIRKNVLLGGSAYAGIGLYNLVESPKSLSITNNTLSHIGFNRAVPESGITIQNNLISDAIWITSSVSEDDARRTAKLEIGHNSYPDVPQPNSPRSKVVPPRSTDHVLPSPFVSVEPTNANYLRITADSPLATGGAGGDLPKYIGALPPGPAPKEGDWFTRLLERWRDVEQSTQKTDSDAAK